MKEKERAAVNSSEFLRSGLVRSFGRKKTSEDSAILDEKEEDDEGEEEEDEDEEIVS